jgi:hypothetical protein
MACQQRLQSHTEVYRRTPSLSKTWAPRRLRVLFRHQRRKLGRSEDFRSSADEGEAPVIAKLACLLQGLVPRSAAQTKQQFFDKKRSDPSGLREERPG